jgi:hypothetical protein
MEAYKIKHKPTGMFWQPHKYRGNTLSKTGKIYGKESYAKSALKSAYVQVDKDSVVYRKTKDIISYQECKHTYNQLIAPGSQSDWEIIKL